MIASTHPTSRPGRRAGVLGIIWLIAYFAARGMLENSGLATGTRVAAALTPVPVFGAFLWTYVQYVRALDELERKIHLEAVSIAFALATLLLTTLALMQRAVALSFEDWSYAHVWVYLPIFYVLSFGFVSRRYGEEPRE
jgi:hypothetical protein